MVHPSDMTREQHEEFEPEERIRRAYRKCDDVEFDKCLAYFLSEIGRSHCLRAELERISKDRDWWKTTSDQQAVCIRSLKKKPSMADERAAFEDWCRDEHWDISTTRDSLGRVMYSSKATREAWYGWELRARNPPRPPLAEPDYEAQGVSVGGMACDAGMPVQPKDDLRWHGNQDVKPLPPVQPVSDVDPLSAGIVADAQAPESPASVFDARTAKVGSRWKTRGGEIRTFVCLDKGHAVLQAPSGYDWYLREDGQLYASLWTSEQDIVAPADAEAGEVRE